MVAQQSAIVLPLTHSGFYTDQNDASWVTEALSWDSTGFVLRLYVGLLMGRFTETHKSSILGVPGFSFWRHTVSKQKGKGYVFIILLPQKAEYNFNSARHIILKESKLAMLTSSQALTWC